MLFYYIFVALNNIQSKVGRHRASRI